MTIRTKTNIVSDIFLHVYNVSHHFRVRIKRSGGMTMKGSSVLVMTIVGGAICPVIMGRIADLSGMAVGFVLPMVCFAFIAWYAFFRAKSVSGE